jgi:DNA-binding response OmpR family regulator
MEARDDELQRDGFGFRAETLPRAEQRPAAHATCILIVDDDSACRGIVAELIKRQGFTSDTARDGEEGWSALCRRKYDLVITDYDMPHLDGIGMIKRLRAVSSTPPCIMITGTLPCPERMLIDILYPGSVIQKPFSHIALIEEVYGLLLRGE